MIRQTHWLSNAYDHSLTTDWKRSVSRLSLHPLAKFNPFLLENFTVHDLSNSNEESLMPWALDWDDHLFNLSIRHKWIHGQHSRRPFSVIDAVVEEAIDDD